MDDEIILRRPCHIEPIGGGKPEALSITFWRLAPELEGKIKLTAEIDSPFFRQTVTVIDDRLRALADLIDLVLAILQNRCEEGYRIYFFNREELDVENFWRLGVNRDDILRNVILSRTYQIRSPEDEAFSELRVEGLRAYETITADAHTTLRLTSKYFQRILEMNGADDFEALRSAMKFAAIYVAHLVAKGFSIHLYEPGDLDPEDMWTWLPKAGEPEGIA
jgi:hypothetical protein